MIERITWALAHCCAKGARAAVETQAGGRDAVVAGMARRALELAANARDNDSEVRGAVAGVGSDGRSAQPVSTAMTAKLPTLQAHEPLDALLPVFERDQVAIVMDGKEFLGLITRIDLLNYLRRAAA
jgi:CBS domain-containing protein